MYEWRKKLDCFQPQSPGNTLGLPEAAVLVPIDTRQQLLLTRRADHLPTHAGEVAFPGGRREPEDRDLVHTALREAEEEIGLAAAQIEVVGRLSTLISLHGIYVTPIVGLLQQPCFKPNPAEIADLFQVPLRFFCDEPRSSTHLIHYQGTPFYVPSWRWQGFHIWGGS
ncbi:hypothetical protein AXE65_03975 [Ventosimonas gracilis]|uniref:Nudix hydrolase domain-containing protein n=1 Tax=Ventosimonas gracilis TaxID=1680762 RepID=A0A139SR81_9GAMM|nr:CoA pyrophosphatase [Ventosimonas gracilis]KXU37109.1 hypothetical protein AXE65_03975 [Ventosimonas gracilis]